MGQATRLEARIAIGALRNAAARARTLSAGARHAFDHVLVAIEQCSNRPASGVLVRVSARLHKRRLRDSMLPRVTSQTKRPYSADYGAAADAQPAPEQVSATYT